MAVDTTKWTMIQDMTSDEIIEAGTYVIRMMQTAQNTMQSIYQRNQLPLDLENALDLLDGEDKETVEQCAKYYQWASTWFEKFKEAAFKLDGSTKLLTALMSK